MQEHISFYENEKRNLLNKSYNYDTYKNCIKTIYDDYDDYNNNNDFIDRITHLELRHRLPELLLMRVDKMGMANSIETRVPYLDHKLVEFALSIPSNLKYRNGVNKYIESLDHNKIPLEYKILDYKPEKWTPMKTSLLLKKHIIFSPIKFIKLKI